MFLTVNKDPNQQCVESVFATLSMALSSKPVSSHRRHILKTNLQIWIPSVRNPCEFAVTASPVVLIKCMYWGLLLVEYIAGFDHLPFVVVGKNIEHCQLCASAAELCSVVAVNSVAGYFPFVTRKLSWNRAQLQTHSSGCRRRLCCNWHEWTPRTLITANWLISNWNDNTEGPKFKVK